MFCEWCGYDFYEVSAFFEGYSILKLDGSFCLGRYCSINCCVAQIEECGVDVEARKQKLYEFYKLHIDVPPAPSPSELIKKGGNLNYFQYRYNFVCPGIETNEGYGENQDFLLSEDDEEDYDSY
jgi:hypothetical protein